MPTSVWRTAVWPIFRVPRLLTPYIAGLPLGQLFGTEDTSEKLFLIKPNPLCLFFNNRNSIAAIQILDLLILTSPPCIELN